MSGLDGSGNFSRGFEWVEQAIKDGGIIKSVEMDQEFDFIKDALSKSVYRDGQAQMEANLGMGGHKLTGVGEALNNDEYLSRGQVNKSIGLLRELGVPTDGTSLAAASINNALSDPNLSKFVFPKGTFNIEGASVTNGINVPSNKTIQMPRGSFLLSANTGSEDPATEVRPLGFSITGQAPTSWFRLNEDSLKYADHIVTNADYNKWDYIEIRSNALFNHENAENAKNVPYGQVLQVIKKIGEVAPFTYVVDQYIEEDYLTSDQACVGKVVEMKKNIVIDCPNIGLDDIPSLIGFGIDIKYADNVIINAPAIIGTKQPQIPRVRAFSAIRVGAGSRNVTINMPNLRYIEWYGVDISSTARNVTVNGGGGYDCSHVISVNWTVRPSGYTPISIAGDVANVSDDRPGEPKKIRINDMVSHSSELSAFDTHDQGDDIIFARCTAYNAGDDGFQLRTRNVQAIDCKSYGAFLDGISVREGAPNPQIINFKAERNGRVGINTGYRPALIVDPVVLDNGWGFKDDGSVISGGAGIRTIGGIIRGGIYKGNKLAAITHSPTNVSYSKDHSTNPFGTVEHLAAFPQEPLLVEGVMECVRSELAPDFAKGMHGTAGQVNFIRFKTTITHYKGPNWVEEVNESDEIAIAVTPQLCRVVNSNKVWGFGKGLFTVSAGFVPPIGVGVFSSNNSFYDPRGKNDDSDVPYNFQGVVNINAKSSFGASGTIATGASSHIPTSTEDETLPIMAKLNFMPYEFATDFDEFRRGSLHYGQFTGSQLIVRSTTRADDAEGDGGSGLQKSNKNDGTKYRYEIDY